MESTPLLKHALDIPALSYWKNKRVVLASASPRRRDILELLVRESWRRGELIRAPDSLLMSVRESNQRSFPAHSRRTCQSHRTAMHGQITP